MTYLQIEIRRNSTPTLPEFLSQDVEVLEFTLGERYRYDVASNRGHLVVDWAAIRLLRSHRSPDQMRMEVVLNFFQQQPSGYLDFQESLTIGKLMEKLKLQSRSIGGG